MTKIEREKMLGVYEYGYMMYSLVEGIEQREIMRREVGGMRLILETVFKEEDILECERVALEKSKSKENN